MLRLDWELPTQPTAETDSQTVEQLINSIPTPKWVVYDSAEEIIQDYIPNCFREIFNEYFKHFKNPVFVRYAIEFPLPHPPNDQDMNLSPPDNLHLNCGLIDPKLLAATSCQFLTSRRLE